MRFFYTAAVDNIWILLDLIISLSWGQDIEKYILKSQERGQTTKQAYQVMTKMAIKWYLVFCVVHSGLGESPWVILTVQINSIFSSLGLRHKVCGLTMQTIVKRFQWGILKNTFEKFKVGVNLVQFCLQKYKVKYPGRITVRRILSSNHKRNRVDKEAALSTKPLPWKSLWTSLEVICCS